jgi:hypothetical protein
MSRKKYHFRKYFNAAMRIFLGGIVGAGDPIAVCWSKSTMTGCFISRELGKCSSVLRLFNLAPFFAVDNGVASACQTILYRVFSNFLQRCLERK